MLTRSVNPITLVNNLMLGGILFTFPFSHYLNQSTPIPPKMEVNIKVLIGYMIQIADSKTNMPRRDREAEVPVCEN